METIRLDNVNRAMYEKFVKDLQEAQNGGEVASQINGARATLSITDARGATVFIEFDLPQLENADAKGDSVNWSALADKLNDMAREAGEGTLSGETSNRVSAGSFADIFKIFDLLLKVAQKQSETARMMAAADSQRLQAMSIAQGNEKLATGAKASSEQMTGAIISGVMCGVSTVMSVASFGIQMRTMTKTEVKLEGAKLADVEKQFNSANKIDVKVDPDATFTPEEQNVLFKGQHFEDLTADEMFKEVGGQKPDIKPEVKLENKLDIKNDENNINNVNNKPDSGDYHKIEAFDDENSEENLINNQSQNEDQIKLDENMPEKDPFDEKDPLNKSFSEKELDNEVGMLEKDEINILDKESVVNEENLSGDREKGGVISEKTIKAKAAYDEAAEKVSTREQALDRAKTAQADALEDYTQDPTPENAKKLEDANKLVSENEGLLGQAKLERAEKAVEFRRSLQADIAAYKTDHNVGLGMKLKNKFGKLSEADQAAFNTAKMLDRLQNSVDAKMRDSLIEGYRPKVMQFRADYDSVLKQASESKTAVFGSTIGSLAPLIKQFGDMGTAIQQSKATYSQAQGEAQIKFMEGEQEAVRGRLEQDRSAQNAAQEAIRATNNSIQQIIQIEAQSVNQTNA